MPHRLVRPPRALRMAGVGSLLVAAMGVQAMTVSYQCTGRRVLTAELTPRQGQLHFEGNDWTVKRVPGGHEAHYVNAKAGISVVTKERTLTFTRGDATLQCFLFSDALPGDAPKPKAP